MSDRVREAATAIVAVALRGGASLNGNDESNLQGENSRSSDSLLSETLFYAGNVNFDK